MSRLLHPRGAPTSPAWDCPSPPRIRPRVPRGSSPDPRIGISPGGRTCPEALGGKVSLLSVTEGWKRQGWRGGGMAAGG